MDVQVQGAADMQRFARSFISTLQPEIGTATVVALSGELGAGKTTFAQALARALGVEETVNSPTFVIEKIYALSHQKWQRLIHIDAYRLKSAEELRALGWERMVADKNNLIVIEWPENVAGAIPESAHRITIEIGEGEGRILKI
ncbi:MAG TPA: tRNA (adenosine(37)-N6)-threonylcarbamoyltransferase complex ATPase subunit type 1 TsaE [Candidatus Paceibacterota bacterium]